MHVNFKSVVFFSVIFIGFFTWNVKAIPFTYKIYGGIGFSSLEEYETGKIKDHLKASWSKKNYTNNAINLSLGISSNIPVQILQNLRIEANFLKNLSNNRKSLQGVGLYYDIKNIPIITPYLGISLFRYNMRISFNSNNEKIKQKINQGLTSFNVGVSAVVPILPLNLYGEYRYMYPGVFKNNLNINKEFFNYSNTKYHVSNFIIGIRYNFL